MPTLTTTPAQNSIVLGDSNTDTATVTGNSTGGAPTGTVTFTLCQETTVGVPCTGGSSSSLISPTSSSAAVSTYALPPNAFPPPTAIGTYCFNVNYGGDTHYLASNSGPECFTVDPGVSYGWGSDLYGQLGDGISGDESAGMTYDTETQGIPAAPNLPAGVTFTDISAGSNFSLAVANLDTNGILTNGEVYAWGDNADGQLGNGCTAASCPPDSTPEPVCQVGTTGSCNGSYLTGISQVSAGDGFALAIGAGGEVYAWGDNSESELGDGTYCAGQPFCEADVSNPVAVCAAQLTPLTNPLTSSCPSNLTGITQVSAGAEFALAIGPGGEVYGWGLDNSAVLGYGGDDGTCYDFEQCSYAPVPIYTQPNNGNPTQPLSASFVSAGGIDIAQFALAVSGGEVYAWGNNASGQLGSGTTGGNEAKPVPVCDYGTAVPVPSSGCTSDLTRISYVSAGGQSSLALGSNGQAYAWGYDGDGELGIGIYETPTTGPDPNSSLGTTPHEVSLPSGVTTSFISAGNDFSLAMTVPQATQKMAPEITITPSALPQYASSASVPYTVTVYGIGGNTPTGTVTISDGSNDTCPLIELRAAANNTATAMCNLDEEATAGGTSSNTYTITVNYYPANYQGVAAGFSVPGTSGGPEPATGGSPLLDIDPYYLPTTVSQTVTGAVVASNGNCMTNGARAGPLGPDGSGVTPNETVTACDDTSGNPDTVTETQYQGNPETPLGNGNLMNGADYFDVLVTPGSSFQSVVVTVCNGSTSTAPQLEYYNGSWQNVQVMPQPNPPSPTGCWMFTFLSGTTPSSSDFFGTVFAVVIPSSSTNSCTGKQGFICAAYADLLSRSPDGPGLAFWSSALASGTSRSQIAYDIATSPEYRSDLVNNYYKTFLGRLAEAGGLLFWEDQFNSGLPDQTVLAGILGSAEFYADSGSTSAGFISALYHDLLGRAPDSGGLTFWETKLASGDSRSVVAAGIFGSNEYLNDFVESQYLHFLDRPADPTGLSFWVSKLAGGTSYEWVIADIVGSSEFYMDATT